MVIGNLEFLVLEVFEFFFMEIKVLLFLFFISLIRVGYLGRIRILVFVLRRGRRGRGNIFWRIDI